MIFGTPPIVTNGLVMHLDAGSRQSYPGSGTTWTNLSGNTTLSGSLVNGPTFDPTTQGSIVFDGINDYVQISGSGVDVGVFFTIQTWVNMKVFGGYTGVIYKRASIISNSYPYTANQGFWICATSQSGSSATATAGFERFFISIGNDQYYATTQTGSLASYVGKWVNLVARVSGSALIKLYINGSEVSSYDNQTAGPSTLSYSTRPCSLGVRDNNNQEFLSGSIGIFSMYNRALSDQEIAQNYNALKARFGLT